MEKKTKKTKKMTKAEAFEWLNNKKLTAKDDVYVNVLFKLFECGIEWVVGGQSFTYYGSDFLIIEGGKLFHCGNDGEGYWRSHHFEEVSVDDILSIKIVEEKSGDTENINIELEKWIEIVRNKFCRHGWSFVISASGFALITGDLIEEKRIKE